MKIDICCCCSPYNMCLHLQERKICHVRFIPFWDLFEFRICSHLSQLKLSLHSEIFHPSKLLILNLTDLEFFIENETLFFSSSFQSS